MLLVAGLGPFALTAAAAAADLGGPGDELPALGAGVAVHAAVVGGVGFEGEVGALAGVGVGAEGGEEDRVAAGEVDVDAAHGAGLGVEGWFGGGLYRWLVFVRSLCVTLNNVIGFSLFYLLLLFDLPLIVSSVL